MTAPVNFYADFKGLAALKVAAGKEEPNAVREAARQFESVFTQMMLKSMRDASLGESMMDSDQTKFYQDMFDNQLAMQLSRGKGLGLADLLVRQLTESGLKPSAGARAKTSALKTNDLMPLPAASNSKAVTQSVTQSVIQKVTKGGAEGGIKDIHGVTPSAPNFNGKTAPSVVTQPAAQQIKQSIPAITPKPSVTQVPPIKATSDTNGPRQAIAQSPSDFIAAMWPHAQKAAEELGVDPKTLIAHAALETGWGKYVPCNPDGSCSFNLFGIKAGKGWKGESVVVNTLEFENGVAVRRNDQFRSYDSAADSFRDYAQMLKGSARYENAVGSGKDTVKFATALQQGGYATDPSYADKLAAIAHRIGDRVQHALQGQLFGEDSLKNSPVQPLASSSSVSGVSATIRQASET